MKGFFKGGFEKRGIGGAEGAEKAPGKEGRILKVDSKKRENVGKKG